MLSIPVPNLEEAGPFIQKVLKYSWSQIGDVQILFYTEQKDAMTGPAEVWRIPFFDSRRKNRPEPDFISEEGSYKDGVQVGEWREFHPPGPDGERRLKKVKRFNDEGEKHGVWEEYDKGGLPVSGGIDFFNKGDPDEDMSRLLHHTAWEVTVAAISRPRECPSTEAFGREMQEIVTNPHKAKEVAGRIEKLEAAS